MVRLDDITTMYLVVLASVVYFASAQHVGRLEKTSSTEHAIASNTLGSMLFALGPRFAPARNANRNILVSAPFVASRDKRWLPTSGRATRNVLMEASDTGNAQKQNKLVRGAVAALIVQNSLVTLATKSTRITAPGKIMYLGSAAVLASELVKLPVCLAMLARDKGSLGGMTKELRDKIVLGWKETLLMGVPALCYLIQNQLFFVALSNLSATSYQLWSQAKTLTTAFFFVFYVGGRLRAIQWFALALLASGVTLVQFADVSASATAVGMNPLLGVSAVLASSLLSGFANAFLEKMLKKSDTSLWVRNVQLGLFSIPQSMAFVLSDMPIIRQHGIFGGFTPAVQIVVLLKALGGLLTAGILKHANNIVKTYATAVAIIVTCLLSIPLYGAIPSVTFLQGMALVIASIFMYNSKPKADEVK